MSSCRGKGDSSEDRSYEDVAKASKKKSAKDRKRELEAMYGSQPVTLTQGRLQNTRIAWSLPPHSLDKRLSSIEGKKGNGDKEAKGATIMEDYEQSFAVHDLIQVNTRAASKKVSIALEQTFAVDNSGDHSPLQNTGYINKQSVRFGADASLHNKIEDVPPLNKDLDLATLSQSGLCLSALPTRFQKPQIVLLRREKPKDITANLFLESFPTGRLGFMEGEPWRCKKGKRVMSDAQRKPYAIIVHSLSGGGKNLFRICGVTPLYGDQRKNRDTGFFTHAEVKNAGGIGAIKFTMNVRGERPEMYRTEFFGPSLFRWGKGQPRGVLIKNAATGQESARITFLGGAKAVLIEPDHDIRLMICFAAIIEEMIGKRLL
ncbi:hypothetical protein IV203_015338 [Nitzschia inconspicua]|uniref:Tubby C-terminal domain-containing protein n=1 Tax=Nitzschia inconspicua TaxID=303405 RepID=A0A9K3LBN5_9STRA|nr:hypothetical protein IV203_015338 [Nitzschia inconspicua]